MPFPTNLTKIDQLTIDDHYYLSADDECYFLGEYTARKGFGYSETNRLIINLKKGMDRKDLPEWHYKIAAIREAAISLGNAVSPWLQTNSVFVPIPPSKAKDDEAYDDRMTRILRQINLDNPVDCRELVVQTESTEPAHHRDDRPNPGDLQRIYSIDNSLLPPDPLCIMVCDDVITTGAHFIATQAILKDQFPGARIVGLFIARRAPEAVDFSEFFDDE